MHLTLFLIFWNYSKIEVAHRSGVKTGSNPRPILVRFVSRAKRDQVLANRRRLKGKGIVIGEDLTSLDTLFREAVLSKLQKIREDPSHPLHEALTSTRR